MDDAGSAPVVLESDRLGVGERVSGVLSATTTSVSVFDWTAEVSTRTSMCRKS
jgi:hypothetical protein